VTNYFQQHRPTGDMVMGNVKVFVLLAGMTALFGVVGQAMGGRGGMLIAPC